jgi:uncharacterized protein YdaU (DUF1376 family)
MSPPVKLRRVDFYPVDWLGGTVTLSLAERGLYITACALIYEAGGPIPKVDLRQAAGGRPETFKSLLLGLVDKGKLQLRDGMIDQIRCQREIARAAKRIAEKRQNRSKTAVLSSSDLNENNDLTPPYARAQVYQRKKEEESNPETSESVAAREEDSKFENDLGVASLPSKPVLDPPTPDEIVEVETLVEEAITTLKGGVIPKGVRDAGAYRAAITDNKFINLVKKLNAWVGTGLDGDARFAAWEVLAAAEKAKTRAGMTRAVRRNLNKIDDMYKASHNNERLEVAA